MSKLYKSIARLVGIGLAVIFCTGALAALQMPVSAQAETTPYNWYFKKNTENKRPPLPSEFSFIERYGGYWLDKNTVGDKVIYLTFDAGYENGNVEKIVDTLDRHGAKGAFFILDNLIIRNRALVQKMIDDGHLVCNHTSKHPDMSAITSRDLFERQLSDLEKLYESTFGVKMAPYYRPPSGRFSEQNMRWTNELGYKTIFWSFAYADWDNNRQPDPAASIERIMTHTHDGMVILLHPTGATNAAIMDELLTRWKAQGYRFGTLDELVK